MSGSIVEPIERCFGFLQSPVAVRVHDTNFRVAQVHDAHRLTHVLVGPQFALSRTNSGQFVDHCQETRIVWIAARRFTQPAHGDVGDVGRLVPIHKELTGHGSNSRRPG